MEGETLRTDPGVSCIVLTIMEDFAIEIFIGIITGLLVDAVKSALGQKKTEAIGLFLFFLDLLLCRPVGSILELAATGISRWRTDADCRLIIAVYWSCCRLAIYLWYVISIFINKLYIKRNNYYVYSVKIDENLFFFFSFCMGPINFGTDRLIGTSVDWCRRRCGCDRIVLVAVIAESLCGAQAGGVKRPQAARFPRKRNRSALQIVRTLRRNSRAQQPQEHPVHPARHVTHVIDASSLLN